MINAVLFSEIFSRGFPLILFYLVNFYKGSQHYANLEKYAVMEFRVKLKLWT